MTDDRTGAFVVRWSPAGFVVLDGLGRTHECAHGDLGETVVRLLEDPMLPPYQIPSPLRVRLEQQVSERIIGRLGSFGELAAPSVELGTQRAIDACVEHGGAAFEAARLAVKRFFAPPQRHRGGRKSVV